MILTQTSEKFVMTWHDTVVATTKREKGVSEKLLTPCERAGVVERMSAFQLKPDDPKAIMPHSHGEQGWT